MVGISHIKHPANRKKSPFMKCPCLEYLILVYLKN